MVDTAVDDTLDIRPKAVPNATAQDSMIATMMEEISANLHNVPLPADTDEDMSRDAHHHHIYSGYRYHIYSTIRALDWYFTVWFMVQV